MRQSIETSPQPMSGEGSYVVDVTLAEVRDTFARGPILALFFTVVSGTGDEPIGSEHVWTLRLPQVSVDEDGQYSQKHAGHMMTLDRDARAAVLTAYFNSGKKVTRLKLDTKVLKTRRTMTFTQHTWRLADGVNPAPEVTKMIEDSERRTFFGY